MANNCSWCMKENGTLFEDTNTNHGICKRHLEEMLTESDAVHGINTQVAVIDTPRARLKDLLEREKPVFLVAPL